MNFELTVLGSASALPTSLRYPTAQILRVYERFFLIDCGEGTQLQLRKNKIGFSKINQVFISHLHGDHVFGLFGLLSTFHLLGRKHPIDIFGPEGLDNILKFYRDQFNEKISFEIRIHLIKDNYPATIFQDKKITVNSFPLKHRVPCYGFLFSEKEREPNILKEAISKYNLSIKDILRLKRKEDYISETGVRISYTELTSPPPKPRSYAFCSDTSYNPAIIEYIRDVDLLYHEATFAEKDVELARLTGHSTARQAAEIARTAGAKKLLLGHFSARYKDLQVLLEEAKVIFENSILVEDGLTYNVPFEGR